jgi:hypothetical protein
VGEGRAIRRRVRQDAGALRHVGVPTRTGNGDKEEAKE